MASTPLHFAIGAATGMVLAAPQLRTAWQSRSGLASATKTWLLASWACGIAASLPSLLKYAGVPETITTGFWMNIFFFHPLTNSILPQNYLAGGVAMGLCFTIQYTLLLLAIHRTQRLKP
jgi:hypothetical protein